MTAHARRFQKPSALTGRKADVHFSVLFGANALARRRSSCGGNGSPRIDHGTGCFRLPGLPPPARVTITEQLQIEKEIPHVRTAGKDLHGNSYALVQAYAASAAS
jgi:hypothetical protein